MLSPQQLKQKISHNIALTIFVSFAVLATFVVGVIMNRPYHFAVAFNPYAMISVTAMIVSFIVLFSVLRHGVQSESRSWFVLYLINAILGATWEALSRLTTEYDGSLFWGRLLGVSIALAPATVYLFALAYTGATAIRRPLIAPLLIVVSSFVAALYATDLIVDSSHDIYPWGYGTLPGPLYYIVLFWIFLPFIFSIVMLLRYRNSNQNELIRKQSLLYAVALAIPMIAGGITDGLLPAINFQIPTMAITFNAITGVIIYYGIRKYQLFQVDPSVLAESILGTMREAVVVARRDYGIEYTNEEAALLFGLEPNPSEPPTLKTLFPKESWLRIKAHLEEGLPLPKEAGHLTAYSLTGRPVPVQIATSKLHERETYSAHVLVLSDISNLTASYNELQASTERITTLLNQSQTLQKQLAEEKSNIEKTVAKRTEELRAAQEKLQAEDRMKQEFIALSSHNLRTPLSVLKWSMELLKKEPDEATRSQLLLGMESGITHLDEFIKDISTINDLEAGGSIEAKAINLVTVLEPLAAQTRTYTDPKQLAFDLQLPNRPVMVKANELWLQNCVRNLLNNALKFTEHGSIGLTLETTDSKAVIRVSDTGTGIREEEIPLLFTKFHRGTNYEQYNYEGRGLALYLTKLIIERFSGTIAAESKNGEGSTFTISLPLISESNGAQPEPSRDE